MPVSPRTTLHSTTAVLDHPETPLAFKRSAIYDPTPRPHPGTHTTPQSSLSPPHDSHHAPINQTHSADPSRATPSHTLSRMPRSPHSLVPSPLVPSGHPSLHPLRVSLSR
ncbi:hypothetical protein Tco_1121052 [Tanacetum coccineum]|uniref:Uncharacterized protein n=1 Tax=Tanacetum coccineum TaxID=301880 RepID=A0ABQ5IYT9_9ASTR